MKFTFDEMIIITRALFLGRREDLGLTRTTDDPLALKMQRLYKQDPEIKEKIQLLMRKINGRKKVLR